ncbi:endo-1,4-beta-xylanase [Bacteroides sp. 51]|uniref:endo-1,4-beta-xylanase n=1 Tax=Bacteroides sp. 51 TaxID=2302938 RepID=UPI0013CFE59E|nr:endo-1,4-beta-xylanase [Bacteroides sp. 51]NDV81936.1 hypothetical protein [Bacteroides sp. 51]
MKLYKIILTAVVGALALTSCDDEKMQWGKPDGHGDVNISDIPLNITEQIANYDFIKKYAAEYMPNVTIGLGMGVDLYIDDEEYRKVVDDNFQILTAGNAMKHASVVGNNGTLNFATIDKFFATVPATMPIYGHNLIWHTQQRASYLNALIAPEVIPQPGGTNLLTNGDFEDGITGWGSWGSGLGSIDVTSDESITGTNSLKVTVSSPSSELHHVQIEAPAVPLIVGHQYEISFWVKSEGDGGVRLSFGDANQMSAQYPWHSAEGQFATTSGTWKEVKYSTETIYNEQGDPFVAVGSSMNFRLDMGKFPNVVYYIDNVIVRDLDAGSAVVNLIPNGDFESGTISPWAGWGNNSTREISADGEGYGDTGFAMVLMNPTDAQNFQAQAKIDFAEKLKEGQAYKLEAWVKSSVVGGSIQMQLQPNGGGQYSGDRAIGTTWTQLVWEFTADNDDTSFFFDFGLVAATYYVDNVVLQEVSTASLASINRSGPIVIEKTPEEKKAIITDAMEAWINGMIEHCKEYVRMWDVLNEPVTDDLRLRGVDFVPTEVGDQEFYWGQYMGKEYALKAFQFARAADPTAKLFINDYNLETNPGKLTALIDYAKWIDAQNGSPIVDGIGTQMHLISTSITREQIDAMFKAMAATGKLVRVTELDVRIEVNEPASQITPTAAQLEKQALVYQWVVESYKENVPSAQQSGITVWTLTDAAREHEYWFKNDAPNLFDQDYGRKYAYKGFCDGIAGRNIGEDFSGDDWKTGRENEDAE